jgi:4-hydroxy-3-methylbut-2-enyl diphosphate reductase
VRQQEATELAQQVDCMIVIGGFNSANTRRLAEVCSELQPRTHHIETAQELDTTWFEGVDKVGVTAGASTPKWIIDDVIERLEEINNSD